jgi:acylphosphatase
MTRFTVHFAGEVQGVGFRYTTCHVAKQFAVAGYVQNLNDGRVKLVVEGDKKELNALVKAVIVAMNGNVCEHVIDEADATGEFGQVRVGGVEVRY